MAYLGQLPRPALRLCAGRRKQEVTFPVGTPFLYSKPVSPKRQDPKELAAGWAALPPAPALPSPVGRRGGQLLQQGLGEQLPFLRGEEGSYRGGGTTTHAGRDGTGREGRRPPPYRTFCSVNSSCRRRRFSLSSSRCLREGGKRRQGIGEGWRAGGRCGGWDWGCPYLRTASPTSFRSVSAASFATPKDTSSGASSSEEGGLRAAGGPRLPRPAAVCRRSRATAILSLTPLASRHSPPPSRKPLPDFRGASLRGGPAPRREHAAWRPTAASSPPAPPPPAR